MTIQLYALSQPAPIAATAIANDTPTAVEIRTWQNEVLQLPAVGTHFGFCFQGTAELHRERLAAYYPLDEGMYFSLAEAGTVGGATSSGIVVTSLAHQGQFTLGGPIALQGQFAYIDGGTTSLLLAPMRVGDPCFHALYMPPDVDQTVHSHPSDRIGLIISGGGKCCYEETCAELSPGTLFHISAHQPHRFVTGSQGLDLVVFHPDSDMGFGDRNHPMLSRTLVNNIRATELPDIQTVL